MLDKPYLLNDHSKIEMTYAESIMYLSENPELLQQIAIYIKAYHQIGNLIPQTVENLGSGHYFPYAESYYEIESSYEIALQGFYRYSLIALRLVLELGLLGVYFSVDDNEHIEIRPWITSKEQTPRRKDLFDRLLKLPNFVIFDKKFRLQNHIRNTFDQLDGFIHTRGYKFSSSKLNQANFNRFESLSFKRYCTLLFSVIKDLIIVLLLKYPVGMQGLPLDEKFGMDGPIGGFLQDHEVKSIISIFSPDEKALLQKISDDDANVQQTVKFFNDLPDLSDDQWKKQSKEWDQFLDNHDASTSTLGE